MWKCAPTKIISRLFIRSTTAQRCRRNERVSRPVTISERLCRRFTHFIVPLSGKLEVVVIQCHDAARITGRRRATLETTSKTALCTRSHIFSSSLILSVVYPKADKYTHASSHIDIIMDERLCSNLSQNYTTAAAHASGRSLAVLTTLVKFHDTPKCNRRALAHPRTK